MMHLKPILFCISIWFGCMYPFISPASAPDRKGVELYSRQTSNQTTVLQVVFKGGYTQAANGKEGLEAILMELIVRGGPAGMDSARYRYTLDTLQAEISWQVQPDYALIELECPSARTREAIPFLIQLIQNPKWDQKFLNRITEERISWLDHESPSAVEKVQRFSRYHYYRGTSYNRTPLGTSASVSAISLNDLKSCHKNNFVKTGMFLVLVSPLTAPEVETWVVEPFARMPLGLFSQTEIPGPKVQESVFFQAIKDSSATPVLYGYTAVPPLSDVKQGLAAFMISTLLDQRLRQEFRLNRNLEVNVYAEYNFSKRPGVSLMIEGAEFKTYALILKEMLARIQKDGFHENEIRQQRERLLTVYYTGLQKNSDLASHIRNWVFCANPEVEYNLVKYIRELSPADIQQCWNKNFIHLHWTYMGLPSLLQAEDLKSK